MRVSLANILPNLTAESTMKPALSKPLSEWVHPYSLAWVQAALHRATGRKVGPEYRPTPRELFECNHDTALLSAISEQPGHQMALASAFVKLTRQLHRESGARCGLIVRALSYGGLFLREQTLSESHHIGMLRLLRELEAREGAANTKQPLREACAAGVALLDTIASLLAGGNDSVNSLSRLASRFQHGAKSRLTVLFAIVEAELATALPWFGVAEPRIVVTETAKGNRAIGPRGAFGTNAPEGAYGTTPNPRGWYVSECGNGFYYKFIPGEHYQPWMKLLRAAPGNLNVFQWVMTGLGTNPVLWKHGDVPVAWLESEAVLDHIRALRSIPPAFREHLPKSAWTVSADVRISEAEITDWVPCQGKRTYKARTWCVVDGKSTVQMHAIAGKDKAYTDPVHYRSGGWVRVDAADCTAMQATNTGEALVCQKTGGFRVVAQGSGWYETSEWVGIDRADAPVAWNK